MNDRLLNEDQNVTEVCYTNEQSVKKVQPLSERKRKNLQSIDSNFVLSRSTSNTKTQDEKSLYESSIFSKPSHTSALLFSSYSSRVVKTPTPPKLIHKPGRFSQYSSLKTPSPPPHFLKSKPSSQVYSSISTPEPPKLSFLHDYKNRYSIANPDNSNCIDINNSIASESVIRCTENKQPLNLILSRLKNSLQNLCVDDPDVSLKDTKNRSPSLITLKEDATTGHKVDDSTAKTFIYIKSLCVDKTLKANSNNDLHGGCNGSIKTSNTKTKLDMILEVTEQSDFESRKNVPMKHISNTSHDDSKQVADFKIKGTSMDEPCKPDIHRTLSKMFNLVKEVEDLKYENDLFMKQCGTFARNQNRKFAFVANNINDLKEELEVLIGNKENHFNNPQ